MIRIPRRPLATAVAAALLLAAFAPVASAQDAQPGQVVRPANERSMSDLNNDQRQDKLDRRERDSRRNKDKDKTPQLYPAATREAPKASAGGKVLKELQAMQKLVDEKDNAGAIAKAEQIVAMSDANAYAKSYAYVSAGNAAADMGDDAKAVEYFKKAVEADGLDNNGHYASMHNLAAMQYGNDDKAGALATLDRFLAETKTEKPEDLSFRAALLADLGRTDEAVAAYKALLAKNPDDKRILMNAVAALQGADKFDEANALLGDAYKRGMLTESRELRALYIGYMNADRWDDARKVIEDGVGKGILQPGPDLSRDYQILAQNAFAEDKIALATELYRKAAPMAADGEAYLNLAKVLEYDGKKSEAKAAAQQALDKGVKKPEDAKRILGR